MVMEMNSSSISSPVEFNEECNGAVEPKNLATKSRLAATGQLGSPLGALDASYKMEPCIRDELSKVEYGSL